VNEKKYDIHIINIKEIYFRVESYWLQVVAINTTVCYR